MVSHDDGTTFFKLALSWPDGYADMRPISRRTLSMSGRLEYQANTFMICAFLKRSLRKAHQWENQVTLVQEDSQSEVLGQYVSAPRSGSELVIFAEMTFCLGVLQQRGPFSLLLRVYYGRIILCSVALIASRAPSLPRRYAYSAAPALHTSTSLHLQRAPRPPNLQTSFEATSPRLQRSISYIIPTRPPQMAGQVVIRAVPVQLH